MFDNVENADDIVEFLPSGSGMRVVVTTTMSVTTLGVPVEVGVYSPKQAVDYLVDATKLTDRDAAQKVAEELGWLPVALTQAATAMTLLGCDANDYRRILADHVLDDVVRREEGATYSEKVGVALRIAYTTVVETLTKSDPVVGGLARQVLGAVSLLAESGVPRAWLHSFSSDDLVCRTVVGELIRRSVLIESKDGTMVSLHRLMGRVYREDLDASGQSEAAGAVRTVLSRLDLIEANEFSTRRLLISELGAQFVAIHIQQHSQLLLDDPEILRALQSVPDWKGARCVRSP